MKDLALSFVNVSVAVDVKRPLLRKAVDVREHIHIHENLHAKALKKYSAEVDAVNADLKTE